VNPEFLREGLAVQDFMNPDRIVVGSSDQKAGDIFQEVYSDLKPSGKDQLDRCRDDKVRVQCIPGHQDPSPTDWEYLQTFGHRCLRGHEGVGLDHRINPHFSMQGWLRGKLHSQGRISLVHLAQETGEDPILLKSVVEVNELQPLRIIELLEKKTGDLSGKHVAILAWHLRMIQMMLVNRELYRLLQN